MAVQAYRPVTVAQEIKGLRVVKEGLSPGDRVIVSGQQRVRTGVQVEAKVSHAAVGHPLHGRRTVCLLFRSGADYLTRPGVVVDLTSETVQVEQ